MDFPQPGFVRVSITCRACWREDVLYVQRGGIMTPERLRRSWRHCAECLSCDIEIDPRGRSRTSNGHRPCSDAKRHETVMPGRADAADSLGDC
jgi:hypothetical protein